MTNRVQVIEEALRYAATEEPSLYFRTAFEQALDEHSRISHVTDDITRLFDRDATKVVLAMVATGHLIAVYTHHNAGWLFTPERAKTFVPTQAEEGEFS
jgi:hypothetical protein